MADTHLQPAVLDGLEAFPSLYLDDIETMAGKLAWEEPLFALWNACLDSGTILRCFADRPVNGLDWVIPDLRSRMAQLPQYALMPLDEKALVCLLRRRSDMLNLRLSDEVIAYLLNRHVRSTEQIVQLFERIAQASLADQRPVTVPYVRRLMNDTSQE